MIKKKCFKCLEIKEIHEFYKHCKMADGHLNKCKECTKTDIKENYSGKREKYAEYGRLRFKTPERKKTAIESQTRLRLKYPNKYKAWNMISNFKRDGKIVESLCEVCGNPNVEAHHSDYNDPLNVNWLCREHHLAIHGKLII